MIWRREDADQAAQEPDRAERRMAETGGRRMAEQGGEVTIVGHGAKLEGTIVSAGSLRIDGQVKGQINADGDVILSPQCQVEADIRAENVSVAGRFKGNIVVKGKAELGRGGRVDGNITSKTLIIEEGGVFQGQSIMDQQAAQAAQAQQAAGQQAAQARSAQSSQGSGAPESVKVP